VSLTETYADILATTFSKVSASSVILAIAKSMTYNGSGNNYQGAFTILKVNNAQIAISETGGTSVPTEYHTQTTFAIIAGIPAGSGIQASVQGKRTASPGSTVSNIELALFEIRAPFAL
jgi:hypothetical protein